MTKTGISMRIAAASETLGGATVPFMLGSLLLLMLAMTYIHWWQEERPASVLLQRHRTMVNARLSEPATFLPAVMRQTCHRPLDQWTRWLIDESRPGRAAFLFVADINQDERQDVITGGYWYANPGQPSAAWPRTAVGAGFDDVVAVFDFDGDGDHDLLGTAGPDNQLPFVWARNKGDGAFTIFTNIESDLAVPENIPIQGVAIARFQPAGPLEVALAWDDNIGGTQMLTVPANPAAETWPLRQTSAFSEGEALSSADIDHDGDIDLFTGSTWLRNDGSADSWTPIAVYTVTSGAPDRNRLVDMDGDGDLDAVVGYGHDPEAKVAWYEQGDDPFALWREQIITNLTVPPSGFPQSLDVGDIDGDGDIDVVAGQHRWFGNNLSNLRTYVMENLAGVGQGWAVHLVYTGDEHHDGTQLLDVENDGDLDIVSIGWTHGRVVLYENLGVVDCASPTPSPMPATVTTTATPTVTITATGTITPTPTIPAATTATMTPTPVVQPTATTTAGGDQHQLFMPLIQH